MIPTVVTAWAMWSFTHRKTVWLVQSPCPCCGTLRSQEVLAR